MWKNQACLRPDTLPDMLPDILQDHNCGICLENNDSGKAGEAGEAGEGGEAAVRIRCTGQHKFHKRCITTWFETSRTCPSVVFVLNLMRMWRMQSREKLSTVCSPKFSTMNRELYCYEMYDNKGQKQPHSGCITPCNRETVVFWRLTDVVLEHIL